MDTEPTPKKAKLVHPDRSTLIPTPPAPTLQTGQTTEQTGLTTTQTETHTLPVYNSDVKVNGSASKNEKEMETPVPQPLMVDKECNNSTTRKKVKKKKKKQKHTETVSATDAAVTSDPTAAASKTIDYTRSV